MTATETKSPTYSVRAYEEADYALIESWWSQRGAPTPPAKLLPRCGFICERKGKPLALGFLYLEASGTGIAGLGWTSTDPTAHPMHAGRAMLHVFKRLELEARSLDYWLITATVADPSLISLLRRRGYLPGDRELVHLHKILTDGN